LKEYGAMKIVTAACIVIAALAGSLALGGCLFVRETEHRIKLNDEGGGEALVRLIDIRSDGTTDSLVTADLEDMFASFEVNVEREFERRGRTLVGKKFVLEGDTLSAELRYTFGKLTAVEGLLVTGEELAIIVAEDREIVRTNGSVSAWHQNTQKIAWPRDAGRLMYRVRERAVPPSVLLGPKYRERVEQ
jgi:hypothetical protein